MPIRRIGRASTRTPAAHPAADSWTTVLFVGSDASVASRLASIFASSSYQLSQTVSAPDAQKIAHELLPPRFSSTCVIAPSPPSPRRLLRYWQRTHWQKRYPSLPLLQRERSRAASGRGSVLRRIYCSTRCRAGKQCSGAALIRRKTRARRAETGRRFSPISHDPNAIIALTNASVISQDGVTVMAYQQLPPRNSLPPEYGQQNQKRIQRSVQRGPLMAQLGCGLVFTVIAAVFVARLICGPIVLEYSLCDHHSTLSARLLCTVERSTSSIPLNEDQRSGSPAIE